MFGQVLVMRLFRDNNILTQICGNNFMDPEVAPPLMVSNGQIDSFVAAIRTPWWRRRTLPMLSGRKHWEWQAGRSISRVKPAAR